MRDRTLHDTVAVRRSTAVVASAIAAATALFWAATGTFPVASAATAPVALVPAAAVPAMAPAASGSSAAASKPPTSPSQAPKSSATSPSPPAAVASKPCASPPVTTDPNVPWAQRQLVPQQVWPLTRGAGITVAVIDTGVDARSPQLSGRVLHGSDVIHGGNAPADTDCYGHGTFVAGIIAAAPATGAGFTGVAPDVLVLPIRAATDATDGSASVLATSIRVAVNAGATVINISASTTTSTQPLVEAVAYAEEHNVVIIAAAANDAQKGDPVTYPASYPTVVAVGAVDPAGVRASFSQTGPYLGLVAPGVNVESIGLGGPGQWLDTGTSFATPFVSGVAALVRAYRPKLTAAQVRHRLLVTADHPAAKLPDPGLGWGTVNPLAAVSTVLPEEGAAGTAAAPPPATHPKPAASDKLGPRIVVLAVFGVIGFAGALRVMVALWPAGRRRRWRRPSARVGSPPA